MMKCTYILLLQEIHSREEHDYEHSHIDASVNFFTLGRFAFPIPVDHRGRGDDTEDAEQEHHETLKFFSGESHREKCTRYGDRDRQRGDEPLVKIFLGLDPYEFLTLIRERVYTERRDDEVRRRERGDQDDRTER